MVGGEHLLYNCQHVYLSVRHVYIYMTHMCTCIYIYILFVLLCVHMWESNTKLVFCVHCKSHQIDLTINIIIMYICLPP